MGYVRVSALDQKEVRRHLPLYCPTRLAPSQLSQRPRGNVLLQGAA
ncbi:hypothetical protein ACPOL_4738 [Acidisarcina polymorpha]|uniref:Resolvase/invertase-type recombinase catalytic domain-containing protein n=1 Tax=Acidisarcina polymorpha TaxID=2211140 RepID=A0A2Z5G625_9BACT|nr:hypothetical protein ACPOL_4738 [Acidisarcina polymorpha]